MKQKLYSDFPVATSRQELFDNMFFLWQNFDMETARTLVDGMKDRYEKVILAKGMWIE